jgi:hypothetical protein
MDHTDLFIKLSTFSSFLGGRVPLTGFKSCGSNVTRTSDHTSTSKFIFFGNSHKSAFEEIGDDNAILPSRDVRVAR